ncbi:uncharacterized protein STEHIDRAFT_122296 [Stereum hirsutum FP-91666 SS1]|uniref:uncharacterized protein n=1 Tax=Stereum hirsutum (strain FP-91666) TaxID=721885 RepID=UPI000444A4B3|nr:uncharacterized protein STEHIDRAFT_122296 [Stereum hirsutum FP-91666 SS1]EIM85319.1 hypothetical protein STEHIDRAFT_122296 [Stereum hirsutum FP-91666 SS1]
MSIDVAVHNPRTRVISGETDRDVVTSSTDVHNITIKSLCYRETFREATACQRRVGQGK